MNPQRLACLLLLALLSQYSSAQPPRHDPQQDEKTAAELRRQYERGDGNAAGRLGNLLDQKRISAQRYGNALDWYRKGCKQLDMASCHNIALAYQHGGRGVERDPAEAVRYYEIAANRAFINSMYNLAILYAESEPAMADPREGLKWMLLAQRAATQCPDRPLCKQVIQDRHGYRQRLEDRLSAGERREVYQKATDWLPPK
jgi:TPR repeat protein